MRQSDPPEGRGRRPVLTHDQQEELDRRLSLADDGPVLNLADGFRWSRKFSLHWIALGKHAGAALVHFRAIRRMLREADVPDVVPGRTAQFIESCLKSVDVLGRAMRAMAKQAKPQLGAVQKQAIRFERKWHGKAAKRPSVEGITLRYLEQIGVPTGGPRAARVVAAVLRERVGATIQERDELRVLQRAKARRKTRASNNPT